MEPPPPPPPSSSLSQCAPLVPVPVPVTSTRAVVTAAEEDDGADGSGSASAATSTSRPVSAPSPPPSASSRHGVTATGVLATTTTALVHNRLTHAAGGMLSSTLTGLFTRECLRRSLARSFSRAARCFSERRSGLGESVSQDGSSRTFLGATADLLFLDMGCSIGGFKRVARGRSHGQEVPRELGIAWVLPR
ncbi:BQ2448_144 [Microbotryum intermedium]|uniref:BQ2448_144 protein n=1 Tax=Microbotryum intermedium TaxID=269621 RepID=A0A238F7M3_9BASI|nr:BQ2448_144 [Microbotryum intermedium]